ncbi:MAG: FHA domain-containing protein [Vicinamibacterales bacterium]
MTSWILETADDPPVVLRLMPGSAKTIGRTARADFILEAPLVSRVHCRLVADRTDQLAVEDLDSTNGIQVNGEKVSRSMLKTGDVLTVGRVAFTIRRE